MKVSIRTVGSMLPDDTRNVSRSTGKKRTGFSHVQLSRPMLSETVSSNGMSISLNMFSHARLTHCLPGPMICNR